MAIPDYQSLMLPLLTLLKDGHEHTLGESIEALGTRFRLTEAERKELLPSGSQRRSATASGGSEHTSRRPVYWNPRGGDFSGLLTEAPMYSALSQPQST